MVKSVIEPFLYFEEKTITYNCGENFEKIISIDKTRVSQVLINLLHNAIKYGVGNQINVSIELIDSLLVFDVSHRGEIKSNAIQSLFDPFYRINMKSNDGTGLGLYICKQIIEKMKGSIEFLQSRSDSLTFKVKIPIKLSTLNSKHVKLLMVDDFAGIRTTKLMLETYGFIVTVVKSGEAAILQCNMEHFDVILMDKNMNGLSGIETVQKIRKFNKTSIIYGFTGDTMCVASENFVCSQNGVNDLLYKPLDFQKLIEYYNRDKL